MRTCSGGAGRCGVRQRRYYSCAEAARPRVTERTRDPPIGTLSLDDVTVGGGRPSSTPPASASAASTRFARAGLKGSTFFANASPDFTAEDCAELEINAE